MPQRHARRERRQARFGPGPAGRPTQAAQRDHDISRHRSISPPAYRCGRQAADAADAGLAWRVRLTLDPGVSHLGDGPDQQRTLGPRSSQARAGKPAQRRPSHDVEGCANRASSHHDVCGGSCLLFRHVGSDAERGRPGDQPHRPSDCVCRLDQPPSRRSRTTRQVRRAAGAGRPGARRTRVPGALFAAMLLTLERARSWRRGHGP